MKIKDVRVYTAIIWVVFTLLFIQCDRKTENSKDMEVSSEPIRISLAQWSLHRAFQEGSLDPLDFASIAKNDYGIDAVEYVNSFYKDHANDESFWRMMKQRADSVGVRSLLIMVDEEGDLGNPDEEARKNAVANHFKWVDAASVLGCHSIRVNAFGEGTEEEVKLAMIDALKQLCSYAANKQINVIIENHGLYSSNGKWIVEIMKGVNMPNVGTLPDFGNWCTAVTWGSTENGKCANAYDKYLGTSEFLPYARGLSAKSYNFNSEGDETSIDFKRMLSLMKESGFSGYVGVEYEGSELSEPEGIRATKALLEKSWSALAEAH